MVLLTRDRSPKIYIYDLPPELDTHQLAFRPSKGWCAPRSFDQYNNTMWIYSGYALETGLHEVDTHSACSL